MRFQFKCSRLAAALVCVLAATSASADVLFQCSGATEATRLQHEVTQYLGDLAVSPATVVASVEARGQGSRVRIKTSPLVTSSTTTLRFAPALGIGDEQLMLPKGPGGKLVPTSTVSKKEIVYALLSPGRETVFEEGGCSVDALSEHVAVRQHIVAWSEELQWQWPDGGPAEWNTKFWDKGTPLPGVPVELALRDALVEQEKYAIGCYTATKMVMAQGVVDYYSRVSARSSAWAEVKNRLWSDGDPLVGIEGRAMWKFEDGFASHESEVPGKLLKIQENVAAGNFVPGDWVYVLNTDKASWEKTGYEGSNAIYLGRNRFNDHYADNGGHYLYHEKLRMVYQWRNGVFSRSRHYDKMAPVSPELLRQLELPPAEGGFVLPYRAVPYSFGFETVPALPNP